MSTFCFLLFSICSYSFVLRYSHLLSKKFRYHRLRGNVITDTTDCYGPIITVGGVGGDFSHTRVKTFGWQTFGKDIFCDVHLGDPSQTFGWLHLNIWVTALEIIWWQKWCSASSGHRDGIGSVIVSSNHNCFTRLRKVYNRHMEMLFLSVNVVLVCSYDIKYHCCTVEIAGGCP